MAPTEKELTDKAFKALYPYLDPKETLEREEIKAIEAFKEGYREALEDLKQTKK